MREQRGQLLQQAMYLQEDAERFDSMVSMGEGVPKAVGEGCGGWRQGTAAGITSPFQTNPELEGRVHR